MACQPKEYSPSVTVSGCQRYSLCCVTESECLDKASSPGQPEKYIPSVISSWCQRYLIHCAVLQDMSVWTRQVPPWLVRQESTALVRPALGVRHVLQGPVVPLPMPRPYLVPQVGVGILCRMNKSCLLYTSPSPRDLIQSRMPSSA